MAANVACGYYGRSCKCEMQQNSTVWSVGTMLKKTLSVNREMTFHCSVPTLWPTYMDTFCAGYPPPSKKINLQQYLFPCHAPDQWLMVDHFVGKLSMRQPTRPTQPSISPGSVNACAWVTEVKTIKRQTKVHAAVRLRAKVRERELGCTPARSKQLFHACLT